MAPKREQVDPAHKISDDPRNRITQKKSCSKKALCLASARLGGKTLEAGAEGCQLSAERERRRDKAGEGWTKYRFAASGHSSQVHEQNAD